MKIVASLIVHNELGRYLSMCVDSLLDFCDEVRALDDASTDGSYEWLRERDGVAVQTYASESRFYAHEGRARQHLLEWTLDANPTHILAIDADEFVSNGRAVRAALIREPLQPVWTLVMDEVWKADEDHLYVRRDGGWRPHACPCLWRVPGDYQPVGEWTIEQKALACGREPVAVRKQWSQAISTGEQILHFGWTNESERQQRYDRYAEHDGGKFHASHHLRSILYPDKRVRMQRKNWPSGMIEIRDPLLQRVRQ